MYLILYNDSDILNSKKKEEEKRENPLIFIVNIFSQKFKQ